MNKLTVFADSNAGGIQTDLNDRVECVLLNEFIPSTPTRRDETVSDQCEVQLRGVSGRQKIEKLNRAFQQARDNPVGGYGVYLNFSVTETDTVYRTRLVNGAVSVEAGFSRGYKSGRLVITIAFEHVPFWEGPVENIPFSNLNGTNYTYWLRVFNCNDLSGTPPNQNCNYVDVAADVIKGDLPAPIKLVIKNDSNAYGDITDNIGWVWIGENYTNPGTVVWNYEGEASSEGGSPITSSICSGGAYKSGVIPAGITPTNQNYLIGKWALSAGALSAFAGQRVRLMLVPMFLYSANASQLIYQISLGNWKSEWVRPNQDYGIMGLELCDFRLPSFFEGVPNLAASNLELRARNSRADVSTTWSVDFVMILPADGWVTVSSSSVAYGKILVLDGIKGINYQADPDDTNKLGVSVVTGESLLLMPGKAHRFYFLTHSTYAHLMYLGAQCLISASYRPRKSSL